MRRVLKAFLAILPLCAAPLRAQDFDHYLLALSWTPSFCAAEGDPGQCDPDRRLGFTLHGLWPQHERGWPEYCKTAARDPSRRETAAMADIMGSPGLAWHQWKKHGRCTDLAPEAYFGVSRRLYEQLALPEPEGGEITAAALEAEMLAANPALTAESVIVTCRGDAVRELRICLGTDFAPRACGRDVLADACRSRARLEMPPIP